MREQLITRVSPGETLQVHSSRGPIGQPIVVPAGVHSVVVVFRDQRGEGKSPPVVALGDVAQTASEKVPAMTERTEENLPEFWNSKDPDRGLA